MPPPPKYEKNGNIVQNSIPEGGTNRRCPNITKAKNILSYFKDKYYKSNVENLISSGIDLIYQSKSASKQLSIVITGSFDEYKRSDLSDIFEANGYKISNTLSKKTNILICGEKPGTKLKKAQSYGIRIIYKDELIKLLSEFR